MNETTGQLRIGELSRRVGVSVELLRAWERRYGLLEPVRSPGGFRLYSTQDERRVRAMQGYLESGLSAAEAARAATSAPPAAEAVGPVAPGLPDSLARLEVAFDRFDEAEANTIFDSLLAAFGLDTVLVDVVLPLLRSLGDRWATGEITVAQEHFASNVLRGRLLGIARGWGRGAGPRALLASPPGEQHDLALIIFGIALRELGWRITFLGADTPVAMIQSAANALDPSVVVLSAAMPERLVAVEQELSALGRSRTLALGGAGATPELAARLGVLLLEGDPVTAAAGFLRRRAA